MRKFIKVLLQWVIHPSVNPPDLVKHTILCVILLASMQGDQSCMNLAK
jgi:hypothetical protein